jgi:neopullulanase
MRIARSMFAAMLAFTAGNVAAQTPVTSAADASYRSRLPEDEIIYFVLPDRFENGDPRNDKGGLKGDRYKTGFDPSHKGFYHGGDLKGLTQRLDYIQGMGVTAIWFAPIFKNKPVQGGPGNETAGYHGYWVTDFTSVDPHFGTNEEFRAFVDAAHKRGIKVYMDIIANHTADVIYFTECEGKSECLYRSKADYPYSRKGGTAGVAINDGFAGDGLRNPGNFSRLTNPNYAYTVKLPKGEEKVKVPAWLNDPQYYHNRGDTTFSGESSQYGDFVGLDDLFTENPRVMAGFIEIYGSWIDRFGIDGFRIDTAKHVNPEFWQSFVPAMLERAKANGIPNFHIFGEIATDSVDPALLARHTRADRLPSVLDFATAVALTQAASGKAGSDLLARLYADDALYEGGENAAKRLPTFLSNHDFGRFGMFVKQLMPNISRDEHLARVRLGLAMLMTMRGVPTIYSGDEQGFVSDGNDQAAREDMFASKVASYNDNFLLGTDATTADANFDIGHPLYKQIAQLSALRRDSAALRRGKTLVRTSGNNAGLIAVSRFDPQSRAETLILFNTSNAPVTGNVEIDLKTSAFTSLSGSCPASAAAPGSATVSLPPLGYAICAASNKAEK